ncbi:MAG: hypothetical protein ACYCW6_15570 [Candidatus Xenobia bacterium]
MIQTSRPRTDWQQAVAQQPLNTPFDISQTDVDLKALTGARSMPVAWCDDAQGAQQIVLSDGPETFTPAFAKVQPEAVLDSSDLSPGVTRVVVDHVNAGAARRQLVMALENPSDMAVSIDLQRQAAGHSPRGVYQRYMDGQPPTHLTLAPGQRHYLTLDDSFGPHTNTLALLQFSASGPLRLQTAYLQPGRNAFVPSWYPASGVHHIPLVSQPAAPHVRGVFHESDQSASGSVDISPGTIQQITLDSNDTPWPAGVDGTPGANHLPTPHNAGNYGLHRTFHLTLTRSTHSPWQRAVVLVVPGGGSTAQLKSGTSQVVQLNRVDEAPVDVLPIFNHVLNPGETVNFDYEVLNAPEYSSPVHLVVIPLQQ